MSGKPDPKPPKRIKDKKLMREMHVRGVYCVICGDPATLHHVLMRSEQGDDVASNLVGLCGSGTTGCHGDLHAGDEDVRRALGIHLIDNRPDTMMYLQGKLGEEGARSWLHRRLLIQF